MLKRKLKGNVKDITKLKLSAEEMKNYTQNEGMSYSMITRQELKQNILEKIEEKIVLTAMESKYEIKIGKFGDFTESIIKYYKNRGYNVISDKNNTIINWNIENNEKLGRNIENMEAIEESIKDIIKMEEN